MKLQNSGWEILDFPPEHSVLSAQTRYAVPRKIRKMPEDTRALTALSLSSSQALAPENASMGVKIKSTLSGTEE